MTKQKAVVTLQNEIRDYTNLITLEEKDTSLVNNSVNIPKSYLPASKHPKRNATIDVARISHETASIFTS